jgi:hypothetical protein
MVREWASLHRDELAADWERTQIPEAPVPIDPRPEPHPGSLAASGAVSCAAMELPSSHTCSRLMASLLKSHTWSIRKVTLRPLPGMPMNAPVTTQVASCSTTQKVLAVLLARRGHPLGVQVGGEVVVEGLGGRGAVDGSGRRADHVVLDVVGVDADRAGGVAGHLGGDVLFDQFFHSLLVHDALL